LAEAVVRDAPIAAGQRQVIAGRQAAVGAGHAAGCFRELRLPGGSADRTNIGLAEIGVGMGSSSTPGWEEFGRPHLA